MRYFIITTIIALAAAKAKSQAKDKLDRQKEKVGKKPVCRKQLEATRECAIERSSRSTARLTADGANPVYTEKKHLICGD